MRDWSQIRKSATDKARLVVIKVGSAVLTNDKGLDARVLGRLADQMAALHDQGRNVVLVSSGAVASGRRVIEKSVEEFKGLPERQAASAVGQSRLMREYDDAFGRCGKITAQILLTRDDFRSRQRFLSARNTFRTLLEWRAIPIINENDVVSAKELEFGDNDALASLVLGMIDADLFVNLTSANGVYDHNPELHPDAKRLSVIDDIANLKLESICDGKTSVGSGGMYSKLLAARRAAQLGVPTLILPGRENHVLEQAFSGQDIGAFVPADERAVSRKKFWMAYHAEPAGSLWVDQGAVTALREKGKSLLPVGVTRVDGGFGVGALVRILDYQGQTVGVGLASHKAADLKKIMGQKSEDIPAALGPDAPAEAIHKDNMLLDPAI